MIMENMNKVSCLSVIHLAEKAKLEQIRSLNDVERQLVMDIASSIISGENFPSIEEENMDATMDEIVDKLTHIKPKKPTWYEAIGNFFRQRVFGTRPSSNDIVNKLIEVKNTIMLNNGRLPEIREKLEEKYEQLNEFKKEIAGMRSCLAKYAESYQKFKSQLPLVSYGEFLQQRIKERDGLVLTLKQMQTSLIEAKEELRNESSEMRGGLDRDIEYVSEEIEKLETVKLETFTFSKKLKEVCDHFSDRLAEEKEELSVVENMKKYMDADRGDLEKTLRQLEKTTQYGFQVFKKELNQVTEVLKNKIRELQTDLAYKGPKIESDFFYLDAPVDLEQRDDLKIIENDKLKGEVREDSRYTKLIDLRKNYGRLQTISNFLKKLSDPHAPLAEDNIHVDSAALARVRGDIEINVGPNAKGPNETLKSALRSAIEGGLLGDGVISECKEFLGKIESNEKNLSYIKIIKERFFTKINELLIPILNKEIKNETDMGLKAILQESHDVLNNLAKLTGVKSISFIKKVAGKLEKFAFNKEGFARIFPRIKEAIEDSYLSNEATKCHEFLQNIEQAENREEVNTIKQDFLNWIEKKIPALIKQRDAILQEIKELNKQKEAIKGEIDLLREQNVAIFSEIDEINKKIGPLALKKIDLKQLELRKQRSEFERKREGILEEIKEKQNFSKKIGGSKSREKSELDRLIKSLKNISSLVEEI